MGHLLSKQLNTWGGGCSRKLYTGRLRPEVQPFTMLYSIYRYIILVMREKVLHIQSMFTLVLNDLNMCEISILNKTQTATVKRMLGNKVYLHTFRMF